MPALLGPVTGCVYLQVENPWGVAMHTPSADEVARAITVLNKVRRKWLRRSYVGAVDVGFRVLEGSETGERRTSSKRLKQEVAIRVHLEQKLKNLSDDERFPTHIDEVPVDVIEALYAVDGDASATDDCAVPLQQGRVDPLMGGVSIGHPEATAGTLGAVVWDVHDGSPHVLSNWHVLAGSRATPADRSTSGGLQPHIQGLAALEPHIQGLAALEPHIQALTALQPHIQALAALQPHIQGFAALQPHIQALAVLEPHIQAFALLQPHIQALTASGMTAPVYQPGRFDGGTAADTVARVTRLRLDRHMDAGLARLDGSRPYAATIPEIGTITAVAPEDELQLGMHVKKFGRSTGFTEGIVDGVSLSTKIELNDGVHVFDDQLHIVPHDSWQSGEGEVSADGDSGAVWVDSRGRAVGLHFAGEKKFGPTHEYALANPMWRVARCLGFSFTPELRRREETKAPDPEVMQAALLAASLLGTASSTNRQAGGGSEGKRARTLLEEALRLLS